MRSGLITKEVCAYKILVVTKAILAAEECSRCASALVEKFLNIGDHNYCWNHRWEVVEWLYNYDGPDRLEAHSRINSAVAAWDASVLEQAVTPMATGRKSRPLPESIHPPPKGGPGTELKALLAGWPFRITSSPTCSCNARAHAMDVWGPDECERQMPVIIQWLREQAASRKLPFVEFAARAMVKLAIARARHKAASEGH